MTEEDPYWVPKNNPFPTKKIKERITELEKEATEDWANKILEGEEFQKKLNKEFLDYVVYGKTPYYGNEKFFKDLAQYSTNESELDVEGIVNKFSSFLSEEELEEFKIEL